MITAIYIGTDRLDLFEDENIVIKSNVSKITDITKVFTDTSNTFTVPATDVNNDIFKHWYNANIVNGFDARKKVPAVIELSGVNFKVGKIKLNKVNLKNGIPYSYSLDYFGNLVALKDLVGNDKLTDLDLSALDFSYNSATVKQRLETKSSIANPGNVIFSLLSERRLLYDSVNTVVDDETQTNIYYDGNNNNTGLKVSDIVASVKQLKVIEAIEDKYNLNFSRDFLGGYDFNNQFLCLTGANAKTPFQIPLTTPQTVIDPTVNGNTMMAEGFGTEIQRQTSQIQISILFLDEYKNISFNCYIKNNDKIISKKENVKGNLDGFDSLIVKSENINEVFNNVTFWIESSERIVFNAKIYRFTPNISASFYYYYPKTLTPNIAYRVSNSLPNIKVIDYLSGLFKMSKLVAIVQKDGTIFIDSISNYYRNGKLYDLTQYIDVSSFKISRGELLNRINYKFENPQTILNQAFKKQNKVGYGDLELDILDSNGKLIDGSSLEFKLPFEQVLYEKINDLGSSDININIQYGLLLDENLNKVDIKPHIHYIENRDTSLKFINEDGSASNLTTVNIPLHVLELESQLYSTTFGTEFNSFNGVEISNTLYSNYHSDFIQRVFSQNKREVNLTARNLPTSVILQLQLNDVIQIKEDYYRIESFSVNTSNNDVDFKLINDRNVNIVPQILITGDITFLTVDSTIVTSDQTIF